jgi:hypothetical protein
MTGGPVLVTCPEMWSKLFSTRILTLAFLHIISPHANDFILASCPFTSLSMAFLLILGPVLLLFLSCKFVIRSVFFSPLSRIPSAHFTSPLSNGWILWQRYRGRENRSIHDAHRRLGPIVRLGPAELSVNSIDALKVIYSDIFDRDEFYTVFSNYE